MRGMFRACGWLAMLASVVMLVGFLCYLTSGVWENPTKMSGYLLDAGRSTKYLASTWLWLVGVLLLVPASLGFFQRLRQSWTSQLGLTTMFLGVSLQMVSWTIYMGILHQLASHYLQAEESQKIILGGVGGALLTIAQSLVHLGWFLTWGVGVLSFSLSGLRDADLPSWIGWVGIAGATLSLLLILTEVAGIFFTVGIAGVLICLVWSFSMGISMIRSATS